MKRLLLSAAIALILNQAAYAGEIHEAAKSGDLAGLRTLLDGDPGLLYVQDEVGKTPLHWATGKHQPEAMKVLLDEYRADVNVRNMNQGTPMHVAASQGNVQGALILIAHGADINARTQNQSTPLHFAVFKTLPGHREAAKILIENGADINAKTDTGATPMDFAQARGDRQMIQLLRSNGAKAGSGKVMGGAGNRYTQGNMTRGSFTQSNRIQGFMRKWKQGGRSGGSVSAGGYDEEF